jgi:hypothetical protein
MRPPARLQSRWVIALCAFLGACASHPGFGAPRHYAYDNTVSAACRNNSANCPPLAGEAPTTAPGHAVASAGYTAHQVLRALDEDTQARIAEALKKCAEDARLEVLLRYDGFFKGVGPSPDECKEEVIDRTGRRITWAMKLGLEMHEVALKCAEEVLGKLRPGGFSIEARYQYDPETRQTRWIRPDEEKALRESGNGGELLGSLKPDIVIHAGDPLRVQAVYDFKFPCTNTDRMPKWGQYDSGPYEGRSQGEVYEEAFAQEAFRVAPHIGVVR